MGRHRPTEGWFAQPAAALPPYRPPREEEGRGGSSGWSTQQPFWQPKVVTPPPLPGPPSISIDLPMDQGRGRGVSQPSKPFSVKAFFAAEGDPIEGGGGYTAAGSE